MLYPEKVKLVIWDLDETFWGGTLSEEGVVIKNENIEIVKTLAHRGILNSICSKNDESQVREKLLEIGVFDYFVFNKISWGPKGGQIAEMIDEMGLRAVNCIFIDDNHMNLREVEDAVPGIFVYEPKEILGNLLSLECAFGKNDENLTRLEQYKRLELKRKDFVSTLDSNVDFLKKCNIVVEIDYDFDRHLDRVLELIERTNQLNYTKQRIEKDNLGSFLDKIKDYQTHAGIVKCRDNYGDYGVVGFFLIRRENSIKGVLEHFVFSCRTMNMGVEAYVYEYLDCPDISVQGPVAYSLEEYKPAFWINQSLAGNEESSNVTGELLLLGPCHLLQLSNFFKDKNNFCQYLKDGNLVKFECPSFFLASEADVSRSDFIRESKSWSLDEYRKFHSVLPQSRFVVLSLEDVMACSKYVLDNGNYYRCSGVEKTSFKAVTLSVHERAKLVFDILNFLLKTVPSDSKVFVLDVLINENTPIHLLQARLVYSHILHKFFKNRLTIIDLSNYQVAGNHNDGIHLDRLGYYNVSADISSGSFRCSGVSSYQNFKDYWSLKGEGLSIQDYIVRKFGRQSHVYKILKKISVWIGF